MSKEWILNAATGRWQLNFKRNVGAVAEEIRKCEPKSLEEWRDYYFAHVRSAEHLEELGRRLYVKISEVMRAELEDISEEDCIHYLFHLVLNRTFEGYQTEKTTVYGQLEKLLEIKIQPAPDQWDRLYNVDFSSKSRSGSSVCKSSPFRFTTRANGINGATCKRRRTPNFKSDLAARFSSSLRPSRAIKKSSLIPKLYRSFKPKSRA